MLKTINKQNFLIKIFSCAICLSVFSMPTVCIAKMKNSDETKVQSTEDIKTQKAKEEIAKKIDSVTVTTANKTQDDNGIAYSDPQKPLVVKKSHPTFNVILKSNQTTGYIWTLKNIDDYLIQPIKRVYISNENNKGFTGGGGYEIWTFMAKQSSFIVPQTTSITLIYSRPWELEGSQATHFKVVTINDN